MEKLDTLAAGHIEHRLPSPERLEEVLASVLDRGQERTERRRDLRAICSERSPRFQAQNRLLAAFALPD
jgi:hypothetical protein